MLIIREGHHYRDRACDWDNHCHDSGEHAHDCGGRSRSPAAGEFMIPVSMFIGTVTLVMIPVSMLIVAVGMHVLQAGACS